MTHASTARPTRGAITDLRQVLPACQAKIMPLTQRAIDELKTIHREETGEILSDEEAWEMGNRLLRVFAVLARVPYRPDAPEKVRTRSRLPESPP